MRGHHVAALGLGLSALFASAFDCFVGPISRPALAARIDDDDDDENPRKGRKLAPGKGAGLALTLASGGRTDARTARLVALGVPSGSAPSPFLAPGPFRATWEGDLGVPFRGECVFSADGRGTLKVELNGKAVLDASGDDLSTASGKTAKLKKGANKLVVTYDSPPSGDALIRLSWTPEDAPREPIPPEALAHDLALEPLQAATRLRDARELLAGLRCLNCHAPASPVGGAGSMPELATDAPDLRDTGTRLRADWLARWVADPKRVPLRFVAAKWKPKALVAFLQQPDRHYAWIKMPNFHLSSDEAGRLAAYLASPPKADLGPVPSTPGDPGRGAQRFASAGCASCHALPGVVAPKATAFASIAPERWSKGCLDPAEQAGRKAPDFGLNAGQVAALGALAKLGLDSLGRDAAPEFAERQVKALNCAACHKRDGSDDAWTDLQVEVASLLEGAPAEEKDPDGLPYPAAQVRPPLTWIGEKLKPEWSAAFIAGKIPSKPRPYLRARMPAFASRAEGLAHGLALGHGNPTTSPPDAPADPDLIPVAQQLVGNMGLNCVSCHNIGKAPAVGVFEAPGINFMHARERLRPSYAARWLRAPIRVDPETKMPSYFNGDASVLPTILDGKADQQIDALWNYLLQGPAIEPPPR